MFNVSLVFCSVYSAATVAYEDVLVGRMATWAPGLASLSPWYRGDGSANQCPRWPFDSLAND